MRPTTEIKVGEHTFIVKTYATAREANAIQQVYFKGAKVEVVGDQPKISDFDPGITFLVQQETIKQMVTAMDGKDENIVDRCLELPSEEFNTLVARVDEVVAKKKN